MRVGAARTAASRCWMAIAELPVAVEVAREQEMGLRVVGRGADDGPQVLHRIVAPPLAEAQQRHRHVGGGEAGRHVENALELGFSLFRLALREIGAAEGVAKGDVARLALEGLPQLGDVLPERLGIGRLAGERGELDAHLR